MFLKFIKFTKKLNYDIQKFENIDYRAFAPTLATPAVAPNGGTA